MKVLHVIDVLTLGGGQALALRVIEALQQRDVENRLCVLFTARRTHPFWSLPVEPAYLEFHGDYRRPLAWRRCVRQLKGLIDEFKPDVVHSLNWTADVTAARACRGLNVPHIAYLVDRRNWLASPAWRHALRRRLTRRAFASAQTHCMAVSSAVAEFVAEHLPFDQCNIDVVQNSIDTRPFVDVAAHRSARGPLDEITVGMLSRLDYEKGHGLLLDAIGLLAQRNVPVRVLIGGEGPLLEEIEQRVAGLGLGGSVTLLGLVDDVRKFYQGCDVFVVPSIHSEGLPTTILESMASGCAVVVSDVGGASEVVENGVDGLIVPSGDPRQLANALEHVITDTSARSAYQQQARRRALDEFGVDPMADRIYEIFNSAIKAPRRRKPEVEKAGVQ